METIAILFTVIIACLILYNVAKGSWLGQAAIAAVLIPWHLLCILFNGMMWLMSFLFGWGRKSSGIHGTSEWAEGREKQKISGKQNDGLDTGDGQIEESKSYQHLLLIGPTGTGKSVRYVVRNILLLALDQVNCSCVVSDPKGELFKLTSGAMQRAGFEPYILAPRKLSQSIRYNPLDYIVSQANADEVASMLIDSQMKGGKSDTFWLNQGKGGTGIPIKMLAFGKEDRQYRNLYNLRYLLNQWDPTNDRLDNFFAKNCDESLMADLTGFLNQDSKVIEGALSTAKAALQSYSDPDLAMLTSYSNFDLKQLRQRRTILYVQVDEKDQQYYSFLQTLFWQQLLNMCMENPVEGKPFLPIRIFLEEVGNLNRIPSLRVALAAARSRMTSISLVLQSKRQLDLIYGYQESQIMIENCLSKLIYPGLDYESAKYVENLLGSQTVKYGNPHDKDEEVKYSERSRPLMYADEIRRLPDNKAILVQGNQKPVLLDTEPYYENSHFSKLAQIPPAEMNYDYSAEELKRIPLDKSSDHLRAA